MNALGEHRLIDDTLTREAHGILARCTCGWSSRGHFSSMAASAAFRDHVEKATDGKSADEIPPASD